MNQAILHIPHSSTYIPFKDGFLVDDDFLNAEILKLTDWYIDDLFDTSEDIIVKADFSRVFCDPERFAEDKLEVMAEFGMGVLYEKSDDGVLIRKINKELRDRILANYYWKHHNMLFESVKNQLKQDGKALIIDCHSFPDSPFFRDLDKRPHRPDFNIGTDPFHTTGNLIDFSIEYFKERGYSLGIDWPYKGTMVPLELYNKNANMQSIMLEVNRKLYLNEPTNEKSSSYSEIKNVILGFIKGIKIGSFPD